MTRYEGSHDESLASDDATRFAIVVARFNSRFTEGLLRGCLEALAQHGVDEERSDVAHVPGAVELPLVCQRFAQTGEYGAVIALGCVVRGATSHYDYVCEIASSGCSRVALDTGVPVIFGVLTTENLEQAAERSGDNAANKGFEAGLAALEMASLTARLP